MKTDLTKQLILWEKEISKRSFHKVTKAIEIVQLDEAAAIRIVINCCTECVHSSSASLSMSAIEILELYNLVNRILEKVSSFNEANSTKYIQSLCHIVKFFLKMGQTKLVSKMEKILILECFHGNLNNENKRLLTTMCSILYENIANTVNRDKTNVNHKVLLNLSKLITRIAQQFLEYSVVIDFSFQCMKCLQFVKIETKHLSDYYFLVIEKLHINCETNRLSQNDLSNIAHMCCITLYRFLEDCYYEECETFFNKSASALQHQDDLLNVHKILRVYLYFYPIEYKEKVKDMEDWQVKFKTLVKTNSMEVFYKTGDCFQSVLQKLLYHCHCKSLVTEDLSEVTFMKMLECAETLSGHIKSKNKKVPCQCPQHNYYQEYELKSQFHPLIKTFIEKRKGSYISTEFLSFIKYWFMDLADYINISKLNNCQKWRDAWKNMTSYFYNISVLLYNSNYDGSIDFLVSFLAVSFKIDFENSSQESKIQSAIRIVRDDALQSKQYERAMFFMALLVYLSPTLKSLTSTSFWGTVKSKMKSREEIQLLTLVSVLARCKDYFPKAKDFIKLTPKNKTLLLILELKYYKSIWPSKLPMMAAFKELCDVADLETVLRVVIEIFGDASARIHDSIYCIFNKIRKQCKASLKKSPSEDVKFCLAVLNFYQFKYLMSVSIEKNMEEMEKSMAVLRDDQNPMDPVPKDPTDRSDIVPAYEDLRLDRYMENMDYLNEALSLLDSITVLKSATDDIGIICKLLMEIAFEYRLHFFMLKSLQAFDLCLSYARLINDPLSMLWCISFIIEHSTQRSQIIRHNSDLITTGDELVEDLKSSPSTSATKVILTYLICKSKAYLHDENLKHLAFDIYKSAEKLYEEQNATEQFVYVKSQLLCLEYHFYLPCEKKLEEHLKHSVMLSLHMAYDNYISVGPADTAEKAFLFETIQELTKAYFFVRLPREVTKCTLNAVLLAQKMVIPLRAAWFLLYLSHADLLRHRIDDCLVKLNGLSDILCTTKYVECNPTAFPKIKIENCIEGLAIQMDEMILDAPSYSCQLSPGSPTLHIESYKIPAFISHDCSCACFHCNSLEYHQLLLEKTRLDALVNVTQKRDSLANNFFVNGINLYKILCGKYLDFKKRNSKYISPDLMPNIEDQFMETYGYILLNYSSYLVNNNHLEEAKTINKNLYQLLRSQKHKHIYLYNEALMQAYTYLKACEPKVDTTMVECADKNDVQIDGDNKIGGDRTPVSKQSKICVQKTTPDLQLPTRILRKPQRINFNSPCIVVNSNKDGVLDKNPEGKEDKFAVGTPVNTKSKGSLLVENNPVTARKRTVRKGSASSVKCTPSLNFGKTPSIRVFIDDNLASCSKTSSKENWPGRSSNFDDGPSKYGNEEITRVKINLEKRLMLDDPASCSNTKEQEPAQDNSSNSDSSIIPLSPEASVLPVASMLKSRTKKLTQKLKQSTCKDLPNEPDERPIISRKKLFNDVSTPSHTPIIRKSTRNKLKCK